MKKIILTWMVLIVSVHSYSQIEEIDATEQQKRSWFHNDFSKTGIYGVGTESALEFLKSKK